MKYDNFFKPIWQILPKTLANSNKFKILAHLRMASAIHGKYCLEKRQEIIIIIFF